MWHSIVRLKNLKLNKKYFTRDLCCPQKPSQNATFSPQPLPVHLSIHQTQKPQKLHSTHHHLTSPNKNHFSPKHPLCSPERGRPFSMRNEQKVAGNKPRRHRHLFVPPPGSASATSERLIPGNNSINPREVHGIEGVHGGKLRSNGRRAGTERNGPVILWRWRMRDNKGGRCRKLVRDDADFVYLLDWMTKRRYTNTSSWNWKMFLI